MISIGIVFTLLATIAPAQQSGEVPMSLRRLLVPESRLSEVAPQGIPVLRAELDRMLQYSASTSLESPFSTPSINSLRLDGTLEEQNVLRGVVVLRFAKGSVSSDWVRYRPWILPIEHARSEDANGQLTPIEIGVDATGALVCRAKDMYALHLGFVWQGRRSSQGDIRFDAAFPSTPQFAIHLLHSHELVASCPDPTVTTTSPLPDHRVETSFRGAGSIRSLQFHETNEPNRQSRSLISEQSKLTFSLSGIQVDSEFKFEPYTNRPEAVVFAMDAQTQVRSIEINGDEPTWRLGERTDGLREIHVTIPSSTDTSTIVLQIHAVHDIVLGMPTTAPHVLPIDQDWCSGTLKLDVLGPLVLQDLRPNGYRLTEHAQPDSLPQVERFVLEQTAADPRLQIQLAEQSFQATADCVEELVLGPADSRLNARVNVVGLAGEAFQLQGRVRDSWLVESVSIEPSNVLYDWSTDSSPDGQRLVIDLRQPVAFSKTLVVSVRARGPGIHTPQEIRIADLGVLSLDSIPFRSHQQRILSEPSYRITLSRIPASEAGHSIVAAPTNEPREIIVDLRTASPAAVLKIERGLPPMDVRLTVDANLEPDRLHERFAAEGSAISQEDGLLGILVMPRSAGSIEWRLNIPGGRRLDAVRVAETGEPDAPDSSERWEVQLPRQTTNAWKIVGDRSRPLEALSHRDIYVSLLAVPEGRHQTGEVRIGLESSLTRAWHVRSRLPQVRAQVEAGVTAETESEKSIDRVGSMEEITHPRTRPMLRYVYHPDRVSDLGNAPRLVAGEQPRQSAWVRHAETTSHWYPAGTARHVTKYQIEHRGEMSFEIQASPEIVLDRVSLAGQNLPLSQWHRALQIPAGSEAIDLEIEYQSAPSIPLGWRSRLSVRPPGLGIPVVNHTWTLALPSPYYRSTLSPNPTWTDLLQRPLFLARATLVARPESSMRVLPRVLPPASSPSSPSPASPSSSLTPSSPAPWVPSIFVPSATWDPIGDGRQLESTTVVSNSTCLSLGWGFFVLAYCGILVRRLRAASKMCLLTTMLLLTQWNSRLTVCIASGVILGTFAELGVARLRFGLPRGVPRESAISKWKGWKPGWRFGTWILAIALLVPHSGTFAVDPPAGFEPRESDQGSELSVYVPMDEYRKPVGDYEFMSPRDYASLLRAVAERESSMPPWRILSAKYEASAKIENNQPTIYEFLATLETEVLVSTQRLEIAWPQQTGANIEPEIEIDGATFLTHWNAAKGVLSVPFKSDGGVHSLRLRFRVNVQPNATGSEWQFSIPSCPNSELALNLSAGVSPPEVISALGKSHYWRPNRRLTAQLGGANQIYLRFTSQVVLTVADFVGNEILIAQVEPGSTHLSVNWQTTRSIAAGTRVAVDVDPRVRPSIRADDNITYLDRKPNIDDDDLDQPGKLRMEVKSNLAPNDWLRFVWVVPTSAWSDMSMDDLCRFGVSSNTLRWIGFDEGSQVAAEVLLDSKVQSAVSQVDAIALLSNTIGLPNRPGQLFRIEDAKQTRLALKVGSTHVQCVSNEQIQYGLNHEIQQTWNGEIEVAGQPILMHRLRVSSDVDVESVGATANGHELRLRWSRPNPEQLLLFFPEPLPAKHRVSIRARRQFVDGEEHELPGFMLTEGVNSQRDCVIDAPKTISLRLLSATELNLQDMKQDATSAATPEASRMRVRIQPTTALKLVAEVEVMRRPSSIATRFIPWRPLQIVTCFYPWLSGLTEGLPKEFSEVTSMSSSTAEVTKQRLANGTLASAIPLQLLDVWPHANFVLVRSVWWLPPGGFPETRLRIPPRSQLLSAALDGEALNITQTGDTEFLTESLAVIGSVPLEVWLALPRSHDRTDLRVFPPELDQHSAESILWRHHETGDVRLANVEANLQRLSRPEFETECLRALLRVARGNADFWSSQEQAGAIESLTMWRELAQELAPELGQTVLTASDKAVTGSEDGTDDMLLELATLLQAEGNRSAPVTPVAKSTIREGGGRETLFASKGNGQALVLPPEIRRTSNRVTVTTMALVPWLAVLSFLAFRAHSSTDAWRSEKSQSSLNQGQQGSK